MSIKRAIDENIAYWADIQQKEREALNKVHITKANAAEIIHAVMFTGHEDKMKILNKYGK